MLPGEKWRRDAFAVLFLFGVWLLLFAPLLLGNQVLYFGDIALYFVPLLTFQRSELLAGRLPFWNPTLNCGTPFIGNPQAWPLYPSSSLLWFLDAPHAVGIIGALHILIAAIATYAFLRVQGRTSGGATLGAFAFAFSGAFVSKLQFPNMAQALAYLPLLLLAVEYLVRRPGVKGVACVGLVVGLSLLAAHPQMFLLQFYTGLSYLLWRLFSLKATPVRWRLLTHATVGFVLGILLASGQLLPVVEFAGHCVRPSLTLVKANRFILPPYALFSNFVLPNWYGNPATVTPYTARGNFWETCAYIGLLPFGLAVWGMVSGRISPALTPGPSPNSGRGESRLPIGSPDSETSSANSDSPLPELGEGPGVRAGTSLFYTTLALLALWLAVGKSGLLYTAAFRFLPGINRFHDPARFLHVATFALACLAALGLDTLRKRWSSRYLLVGILALTVFDLWWFDRVLHPLAPASVYEASHRTAERLQLKQGERLYPANDREIWREFVSFQTYERINTPEKAEEFLGTLGYNLLGTTGARSAKGYEPVPLANFDELQARDFSLLGASRTLQWSPETGTTILEAAESRRAEVLTDDSRLLPLTVTEQSPQSLQIVLPTLQAAGTVTLRDTDYPTWKAYVDAKPVPITPVEGAFRAVRVPAGAKVVTFRNEPTTFRLGLFLSLCAFGTITGLFARAGWKSRSHDEVRTGT